MLVNSFILPLAATTIIEAVIAYLMGWRGWQQMLLVVVVNAVTNPLINFIAIGIVYAGLRRYFYFFVLPLELLLIPAEYMLLNWAMPRSKKELIKLSVCMNASSFLIGMLIF